MMGPHKILVMRHAEKPDNDSDPNLSQAGYARAAKLATWIPEEFGSVDFIVAAANSKESYRPRETVTPLANKLNLTIDLNYADDAYTTLAHDLRHEQLYGGKVVLVCWHHGHIPDLMKHLKVPDSEYPAKWPSDVFNWTYEIKGEDEKMSAKKKVEPF